MQMLHVINFYVISHKKNLVYVYLEGNLIIIFAYRL